MRKLVVILLVLFLLCGPAFSHGGKTDSKGGHKDSSTGMYHYHHGYPAHDHDDGVCPYDFDDKTGQNSGTSSGSGSSSLIGINSSAPNNYRTKPASKEMLPMTIGNIILFFSAGLGLGLIILWIYAHKVDCREASMRIEAANRETNAFKRGGEAAETRLKLKEQELAKRENDLMKQYFDISDSIEESRRELEEIRLSLPSSESITPVKIAENKSIRTLYHKNDSYCIYSGLTISLYSAEQMGLKPCPKCKPVKYKIIYPVISAPQSSPPARHPD